MVRVKLIGAGGYGGVGFVELACRHPQVELAALVDVQDVGRKLSDVWPHLAGFCDLPLVAPDSPQAADDADVVVCATPDGVGQAVAPQALAAGARCIDYSGDFRFADPGLYAEYARRIGRAPEHASPQVLEQSVYGLPELHRGAIRGAHVVGNPGCFAVSCILALAPAVRERCLLREGIACDCKTGISGAGKKPRPGFHYPESYEAARAYKLAGHQHVMEIEHELSLLAEDNVRVAFTPQVVPMARGILSTVYGRLAEGMSQARALEAYQSFYQDERFVRVLGPDAAAGTDQVRGSNFAIVQVACDERTGTFRAMSYIDNLVKGQAGNAMQNLNILFDLDEALGLDQPGAHP